MTASRWERWLGLLSPVLLILLWEAAARLGWLDTRFFSSPARIVERLAELVRTGELWANLWVSLVRLFWGCLLGGIPALGLGILMGLCRPIRFAVDPLIAATYPLPKSAILPL